ncbi:PREDICTED: GATA zinc finger domain-containing protein 10-like, partial [Nicrophorus vespilloides]|uniref:GATA zinc finger domain-containing protein 10-like n=1 Tax=Nicrophorus vespilloides TaxID=110193 RepID=A0ABM1N8X9_NICVS
LYSKPPPRILSHQQSQNHDGGFKFAFAAENGLAHSEAIAPDGSRNGGYSYVDPHGKTISVKYTAGKEGFRILEGQHVPKESPQHQAIQQQQQQQQQQQYQQPEHRVPHYAQQQQHSDHFRIPLYTKQQHAPPPRPVYIEQQQQPKYSPQPRYPEQQPKYTQPKYVQETSASNSVEESKEPEYNDEPGKAYSFGNGYAFQFSG